MYTSCFRWLSVSVSLLCTWFLLAFLVHLFCDMWGENVERAYHETKMVSYRKSCIEQTHIETKHENRTSVDAAHGAGLIAKNH